MVLTRPLYEAKPSNLSVVDSDLSRSLKVKYYGSISLPAFWIASE